MSTHKDPLELCNIDDLPPFAVAQCRCTGCNDPLYSTDERRDFWLCPKCSREMDDRTSEAEMREQMASWREDWEAR